MQSLLASKPGSPRRMPKIDVRRLARGGDRDFGPLLKETNDDLRQTRFVIDASLETSALLLKQAWQLGMTAERYHYVLANLVRNEYGKYKSSLSRQAESRGETD